jgi:AcrR family transcriptional regulator
MALPWGAARCVTITRKPMSVAHHRPKQPEQVKAKLLAVTMDLLVDHGIQAVTLDAVARQAEVSKGGLLHHFNNKSVLLDALTDELFALFEEKYALAQQQEAEGPVRQVRAYVRVCFMMLDPRPARALGLLNLYWPYCARLCGKVLAELVREDGPDPLVADQLLIVRLAAEGFWYANMQGFYGLTEPRRNALCHLLLRMCDDVYPVVS